MQKICRAPLLGLIFLGLLIISPSPLVGKIIWESFSPENHFSFSGYQDVFINTSLQSPDLDQHLKKALRKSIGTKGELIYLHQLTPETVEAIGKSRLFLHVLAILTKDQNIKGVNLAATTSAIINQNHTTLPVRVWEKFYLLDLTASGDQEVLNTLEKGIDLFISEYFKTNPEGIGKTKFYLPQF